MYDGTENVCTVFIVMNYKFSMNSQNHNVKINCCILILLRSAEIAIIKNVSLESQKNKHLTT